MPRQSPHTERLLDIEQLGERIHRSPRWVRDNWRSYRSLARNVVKQGRPVQLFWPDDVVGKYVEEQRRIFKQKHGDPTKRYGPRKREAVSS